ncbi:MAG: glycosyltransferase family 2 protein [Bacteroidales bacterium]|nr:glycosyltransferase family 2 protein [Bacteroidales bacterium]
MEAPLVSIVIVCMNRLDNLYPCLEGIRAHTGVPCETLVVAYRFSPENLARAQADFPWVRWIVSDGTRGFSENNNLALREARGRYCFVVNDDTLMQMPVIDRLVEDFARLPEDAAAVSPCIRFPDGRVQTCGRGPWTPWRYARHYLHLVDETRSTRWTMQEGLFRTYTLNGACFLIRTDIFREAGWFDERFFFTPEDIALGDLLNRRGRSVWTDADVSITHVAGGSVSALEAAIKPARVRGSLLFYGEPLLLKLFICCFEALRVCKYAFLPRTPRNTLMRRTAVNVLHTVFSGLSPKEIFIRFANG